MESKAAGSCPLENLIQNHNPILSLSNLHKNCFIFLVAAQVCSDGCERVWTEASDGELDQFWRKKGAQKNQSASGIKSG